MAVVIYRRHFTGYRAVVYHRLERYFLPARCLYLATTTVRHPCLGRIFAWCGLPDAIKMATFMTGVKDVLLCFNSPPYANNTYASALDLQQRHVPPDYFSSRDFTTRLAGGTAGDASPPTF